MFALSTANQMAPHVGKKQKKPKELKLFSKKASAESDRGGEKRSAEDDKAAFRRLKQFSKQRAAEYRAS